MNFSIIYYFFYLKVLSLLKKIFKIRCIVSMAFCLFKFARSVIFINTIYLFMKVKYTKIDFKHWCNSKENSN